MRNYVPTSRGKLRVLHSSVLGFMKLQGAIHWIHIFMCDEPCTCEPNIWYSCLVKSADELHHTLRNHSREPAIFQETGSGISSIIGSSHPTRIRRQESTELKRLGWQLHHGVLRPIGKVPDAYNMNCLCMAQDVPEDAPRRPRDV